MFDDVRLPDDIEQGAQGGPTFSTTIVQYGKSKGEKRNANWQRQRLVYDIAYGIQEVDDYQRVLAFFYARRGRAGGFRFKDWSDYQGAGQILGVADGASTAFQLTKTYDDAARPYVRRITRPVIETLTIRAANGDGSHIGFASADLGLVTFGAPPAAGLTLIADFDFDVPVRFDVDELDMTIENVLAATIPSIKLIELPE